MSETSIVSLNPSANTSSRRPKYLPKGWTSCIQPEGQLYFYNEEYHVVTEAYIHSDSTLKRISYWIEVIESLARAREIKLLDTVELFLQLEEEDDGCSYYLIDHVTQTEFWLLDYSSEELNMPASLSLSQLSE